MTVLAACAEARPGQLDVDASGPPADAPRSDGAAVNDDAAPPVDAAPDDAAVADGAAPPTGTFAFQNGVAPTAGYQGCADTYLAQRAADTSHGGASTLNVDGDDPNLTGQDLHILVRWDVTTLPAGARAAHIRIAFNVADAAANQAYQLFALRRAWVEDEATWQRAAAGTPWQGVGASGVEDRAAQSLGSVRASDDGPIVVTLGAAGVAVVQGWIDDPSTNHGLTIVGDDNTNGLDLDASDVDDGPHRPRLEIELGR